MPTSIQKRLLYHEFYLLWSAVDSQLGMVLNIIPGIFNLGIGHDLDQQSND
jgi:hypothetical protein